MADAPVLGSFLLTSTNQWKLLVPVSWSLSLELYFYALFALSFALSLRTLKILLHLFLLLMLWRIEWVPDFEPLDFLLVYFLTNFLAGACLYIYRDGLKQAWMLPLFLALAIATFYWGVHINALGGAMRVYSFGTSAVCLLAFVVTLENRGIYRAGRWLVAIGDASYTLYLSHTMLVDLFYHWGLRDLLSRQPPWLRELGFGLVLAGFVGFSVLVYRLVEKPVYKAYVRRLSSLDWAAIRRRLAPLARGA